MLAFTGLRFGEFAALRVGRVYLVRRRLEIAESVTEVNGVTVFGTPKTHHRRSVSIPRSLIDELARVVAGREAGELLFTAPEGGVMRVGNFRKRVFDRAATEAGLPGPGSRRTSYGTPPRASLCPPAPTSRPCSDCWATPPRP
jgi:integrase